MQPTFRERLRKRDQVRLDLIESKTGFEVHVRVDKSVADARMRIELAPTSATIVVQSGEAFTPGGAYHELSHAELYYLRGVPHLVLCEEHWSPEREATLVAIDNGLEHLFIIPPEIREFPERRGHWISALERLWGRILAMPANRQAETRMDALFAWVETATLDLSVPLMEQARTVLEQLQLTGEATTLLTRVRGCEFEKVAIARAILDFFGLNMDQFCLERIDPGSREVDTQPLTSAPA